MVVLFIEIGRTGCEDSLVLAMTVHCLSGEAGISIGQVLRCHFSHL